MSTIAERASRGALWTALSFGVTRASTLLVNLTLARFLSPTEFGTIGFAMVFIGVLLLLQDLGVPAAIIYGRRSPREVAGTALTLNVATALGFTVLVIVASPFVAQWGDNPTVQPVVVALSAGLIVYALGSVQNAVLTRELAFKKRAAPDVVPAVSGGLVSIVLALLDFGVWSLVAGYTVKVACTTVLLWVVSDVRPRPELRLPIAAELFRYGRHASLASIVGFVAGNSDYLIVGALMGSHALGVYTLAYNLASLPSTVVTSVIATVLFPALSSVREDRPRYLALLAMAFHTMVAASVMMSLGIYLCAPSFIETFLTGKWSEVVAPLQILAAFGLFRSVGAWTSPVFKASGRPDLEWRLSLVRLGVHVALMLALAGYGIAGIASSHLAVSFAFALIALIFVGHVSGIGTAGVWRLVRPHCLAGLPTAALLAAIVTSSMGADIMSSVIAAPVLFALAASAYVGLLSFAEPATVRPLCDLTARLLPGRRGARAGASVVAP